MYDDVRITATATSEPTDPYDTMALPRLFPTILRVSLCFECCICGFYSGGSVEPACLAVEAHEQFVGFDIGCGLP